MKFRIHELEITFKKAKELIPFKDFSYFYGQMGAGKSTIARLIDFCLGGSLGPKEMTPALQSEFVSAALLMEVNGRPLNVRRDLGSNFIRANWTHNGELVEVMIPSKKAQGEVIESSGIEVISDLIFFLSGHMPPKVRRSKVNEESDLARLSLHDLFWYCYLDQDSMDSSFFHLDADSDRFKMLKSRDVLRLLIGFHQEHVSELEVKLELQRNERIKCEAGAKAIKDALSESDIASETELTELRRGIEEKIKEAESAIEATRSKLSSLRPHAMDNLQDEARKLANRISELEQASIEIRKVIKNDKAHKNELLSLSTRFRRSQSAREVLSGVKFRDCPSCGRELPGRENNVCSVCGRVHAEMVTGVLDESAAERDLDARVAELSDLIERHEVVLRTNERYLRELQTTKGVVDNELNRVAADYDSAYLSAALEAEKKRSALRQQLADLDRIEGLVRRINELLERVSELTTEEQNIRAQLVEAREKAEKDTQNLERLKAIFLDCLIKSKLSGFYSDDIVHMKSPDFLPELTSASTGDLVVTSFNNLGSGGKKTLFKCCFAVAVHRLATEINALLPAFLIIDSPMKNISERENRKQFEGFYEMLYELSGTELKGTQIIVIDKELHSPPKGFERSFEERHMRPNERDEDPGKNPYPPLIRYYAGK